jgi:hypothetical protein
MNHRRIVQLPPQASRALADYLQESGSDADPAELAAVAIEQWLEHARAHAEAGRPGHGRGYQWKDLFLPSATRLRMYFDGRIYYAEVEDDDIIFEGRSVSPAQMANKVAGGTRNAWRDLWILCPGEQTWKLASVRRRQARDIEKHAADPAVRSAALRASAQPAPAPADDTPTLRRLANLLERALLERGPQ